MVDMINPAWRFECVKSSIKTDLVQQAMLDYWRITEVKPSWRTRSHPPADHHPAAGPGHP